MTRYCVTTGESAKRAFLKAKEENPFLDPYKAYFIENSHCVYSFAEALFSKDKFLGHTRNKSCRALVLEGGVGYFFFIDPPERTLEDIESCVDHLKEKDTPITDRILKGLEDELVKCGMTQEDALIKIDELLNDF